jgi:hypothetical protein
MGARHRHSDRPDELTGLGKVFAPAADLSPHSVEVKVQYPR